MSANPNDAPDTPLDPREPVDPRQWAMHGLLATYFETLDSSPDERAAEILRRIGLRKTPPGTAAPIAGAGRIGESRGGAGPPTATGRATGQPYVGTSGRVLRWRWGGGLAVAAAFLAVIGYFATVAPTPASADGLQRAARAILLLSALSVDLDALLSGDDSRLAEMECEADQYFAARDAALGALERGELPQEELTPAYEAWARAYRLWRRMGRWQAALDEMQALAEHAERFHAVEDESPWPHIAWADIGDTLMVLGDTEGARAAHFESLARRERIAAEARACGNVAVSVGSPLNTLVPIYWRLSDLALAEDDAAGAAAWLTAAEELLHTYYAAVCAANGIRVPPEADALMLVERYVPVEHREVPEAAYSDAETRALVRKYNGFPPSQASLAKLRGQTYRVARAKRLAGDLDGAEALLKRAEALTNTPAADEERLQFAIPIEFARLAIARDDWPAALHWLDAARENSGPVVVPKDRRLDRPEISGVRRSELTLLTGLVGMKLRPQDRANRDLVGRTLRALEALGAELDETKRERFLEQFRAWRELIQTVEGSR